jgi:glycosyltransferase involved in cell wall biosynthesis
MAALPLISVCLSVYNAERYVGACVQSVLGQTLGDFEFIIIDDGSTDGSRAILQRFAAQDSRIRLISRENRGIVASANEELSLARGEFIARIDADDLALPNRFERQIQFLHDNPEVVCCGSRVILIDPDGRPLTDMPKQLAHDEIVQALFSGGIQAIYNSSTMLRKSAVERVGGYRSFNDVCEDLDLFLRLAEIGKLANVPEVLTHYRQHLHSVGHKRMQQICEAEHMILEEAYHRRGQAMPQGLRTAPPKPISKSRQFRKWAWWALSFGQPATARRYAFRALLRTPLSPHSWRVTYCALRGR